jgi:hypothetical protein
MIKLIQLPLYIQILLVLGSTRVIARGGGGGGSVSVQIEQDDDGGLSIASIVSISVVAGICFLACLGYCLENLSCSTVSKFDEAIVMARVAVLTSKSRPNKI